MINLEKIPSTLLSAPFGVVYRIIPNHSFLFARKQIKTVHLVIRGALKS